jgi:hypothetical protein
MANDENGERKVRGERRRRKVGEEGIQSWGIWDFRGGERYRMGKLSEVKKRQIKREDGNRKGKRQQEGKKTFRAFLGLMLFSFSQISALSVPGFF